MLKVVLQIINVRRNNMCRFQYSDEIYQTNTTVLLCKLGLPL